MPNTHGTGVTIRGLVKSYGAKHAVDGVNLDAAPGQITGLLGRNGAGKTTTLECLLGLRRPDAGTITIDGIDARAHSAEAKRRVGAQLQATALQDKLTPREALRFFASFYPDSLKPDDLLGRFDLSAKADDRFETLSAGQRQRLGLALAIVNDPAVLVLDEPTAGLDAQARRHLHDLIVGLRDAGRTVLLSTHDLSEAGRLCDHVVVLSHGVVIAAGPPADLSARDPTATVAVVVRTAAPLPPDAVRSMAIVRAEPLPDGWRLSTTDLARCLADVAAAASAASIKLTDVYVERSSLEDDFLRRTDNA